MKKTVLMVLVLIPLIMASCSQVKPSDEAPEDAPTKKTEEPVTGNKSDKPEQDAAKEPAPSENEAEEAVEDVPSKVMADFMMLISPSSSSGDLGLYMKEHLKEATPEDAEMMLQWLLIYQTETKEFFNNNIYTEPYFEALNITMGGVVTPEKINDIEDDDVRQHYQTVVDGFMTVVRYEETPVLETDWTALTAYNDAFSDAYAKMLTLYSQVQFSNPEADMFAYAEQIIVLEDTIKDTEDGFLKSQLQAIHKIMVSDLLVGPEGMYIGTFVAKNDAVYNQLTSFAAKYPDSDFGILIQTLAKEEWTDFSGPQQLIKQYFYFGYDSDFIIYREDTTDADTQLELYRISSIHQPEIAEAVNDAVDAEIQAIANAEGVTNYTVSIYPGYASAKDLSLFLSFRYVDEDNTVYRERPMTFDMTTGKELLITEYLGMNEKDTLAMIETTTGSTFERLPYVEIWNNMIILRKAPDEPTDTYYAILTPKDLIPYVEFSRLSR